MKIRKIIHTIGCDLIGAAAYAAAVSFFVKPAGFLTGGLGGLSLILYHYFTFPVGVSTLIMNVPVVIFTWKILGKSFILHTIRILVFYTLFVDFVYPALPAYSGDPMLAALFGGIINGAALGFLTRGGACTGGTDFLVMSINKKQPHRSVGTLGTIFSGVVIVAGGFVFQNINAVLYGLVLAFVQNIVFDRMVTGAHAGKTATIITTHPHDVADAIFREMDRGVTIFRGEGGYTGVERDMVLCACSKAQVTRLRAAVRRADERAIVMISDYKETFGKGFDKL